MAEPFGRQLNEQNYIFTDFGEPDAGKSAGRYLTTYDKDPKPEREKSAGSSPGIIEYENSRTPDNVQEEFYMVGPENLTCHVEDVGSTHNAQPSRNANFQKSRAWNAPILEVSGGTQDGRNKEIITRLESLEDKLQSLSSSISLLRDQIKQMKSAKSYHRLEVQNNKPRRKSKR